MPGDIHEHTNGPVLLLDGASMW
ncbi:MAG: hypothetical protein JWP55_3842, partial [Mycobacterium sp.]|nr:hypothetical protein [Mycobacterium sp.]